MECACARSERHLVVLPAGSSCSRRRSRGSRDFFCALPCVSTFPSLSFLSFLVTPPPPIVAATAACYHSPQPASFFGPCHTTPHAYAYAYAYAYARLHSHPHLLSHAHPRYNACTMHVQCTADNFEWKTPAFGKKRYLWIEIQMEYEYAVVRRWRRYHSLLHCCCCCLGHLLSSPHIWSS